ncbi:hypothetical protein CHUAL_001277 [Chamberlinius hualienensis]
MMIPFLGDPNFRRRCLGLMSKMVRTRDPDLLGSKETKSKLTRCLTTLDLTSLGVGSCVGTGMYLVAGMVAHKVAGPGVIFSFIIAAVAALFSGVCYAEFGVRVPHTTGSAYMYSYVTVGEFIAFVIGWNMILEYLIGSAACACALSACFDVMSSGAITEALTANVGNLFGRPPDFLAFGITIFMTMLLVAGVRKSLIFNNTLNVINLAIWVFIMTAGLFYADTSNWRDNGGFLPHGWSGVLTGAATCFYAFIGFDIIATTGEEAFEPKKSIPRAIIVSLAIIVVAYVTTSMMATLIVPFQNLDPDSAIVEMFHQRGSLAGKFIVSVGAMAGLSVSMFGSMFPMPRVVYAMAKDGLIFKFLSQIWPITGTPAVATCIFGLAAAFASLIIPLDILVEMMSIGTLLAYTLVSTCVLVLRYQPDRLSLTGFLPESIRNGENNENKGAAVQQSTTAKSTGQRKVVRIKHSSVRSPDSCDENPDDDNRYSPSVDDRDDDNYFNKNDSGRQTYGNVGDSAPPGGNLPGANVIGQFIASIGIILDRFRLIQNRLTARDQEATDETGYVVTKLVGVLYIFVFLFDITVVSSVNAEEMSGAAIFFIVIFLLCIVATLFLISRNPQCRHTLKFMAPGLPFVPGIAITVNIYLIFKLSLWTLARFATWMIFGMALYFRYGIRNSTVAGEPQQSMEMAAEQEQVGVVNNYHSFPEPNANPSINQTESSYQRNYQTDYSVDQSW